MSSLDSILTSVLCKGHLASLRSEHLRAISSVVFSSHLPRLITSFPKLLGIVRCSQPFKRLIVRHERTREDKLRQKPRASGRREWGNILVSLPLLWCKTWKSYLRKKGLIFAPVWRVTIHHNKKGGAAGVDPSHGGRNLLTFELQEIEGPGRRTLRLPHNVLIPPDPTYWRYSHPHIVLLTPYIHDHLIRQNIASLTWKILIVLQLQQCWGVWSLLEDSSQFLNRSPY